MKWVLVALVGLAGCPGTPDPPTPDATPTQTSALHLEWLVKPSSLPDDVSDKVEVRTATFQLGDLRVIGDATSGNPPTFADPVLLEWADGKSPSDSTFEDVPVGIYSLISFELRPAGAVALAPESSGSEAAFEITGIAEVDNEDKPFRVIDTDSLQISSAIHVDLKPAEQPTVKIECDLTEILGDVRFGDLQEVDGELLLTKGDDQMPALRTRITNAFASK